MIKHIWFDFSDTLALVNKDTGYVYRLTDKDVPEVLGQVGQIIPISLFSNNVELSDLSAVGINPKLFTNILNANKLNALKPALKGFHKIIELSKILPAEILYIGDHLEKDIIPAKTVGMKTAAVFVKLQEADYYFKDFRDILKFAKSEKILEK